MQIWKQLHPTIYHFSLNLSNWTIKSLTLITVICYRSPGANTVLPLGAGDLGSVQAILDVLSFDFDDDSLCNCVRSILCVA